MSIDINCVYFCHDGACTHQDAPCGVGGAVCIVWLWESRLCKEPCEFEPQRALRAPAGFLKPEGAQK